MSATLVNRIERILAGAPSGNQNAAKGKEALKEEAKKLAAQVNDPDFKGDRWETSMKLSVIMKKLGAQGVDKAAGESDESEIEATCRAVKIESLARRITAAIPDKYAAVKKLHDQVRSSAAKIYMAHLQKLLAQVEAETLRNIRKNHAEVQARHHGMRNDVIYAETTSLFQAFNLDAFEDAFSDAMNVAAGEAYAVCAQGLIGDQPQEVLDRVTDKGIVQKFQFARANRITNCAQEIFNQIQDTLNESDGNGETMQESMARVQDEFQGISENRASLIAQTESLSAYGTAQHNVLTEMGVKTKIWQTSDDELVRPSHVEYGEEGQVDLDDEYAPGLKFPGDPHCDDAGEVCNCRCFILNGDDEEELDDEDDE